MTKIVIDLNEALIGDLGRMAARNGLSVDAQAERLLSNAVQVSDRSELVARLRAIAAMTPADVVLADSVEILRDERNK